MDYTNDEFIYELKRLDEINRRREIVRLSGGVVLPINSSNFPNLSVFIDNSDSFNDIEEFALFLEKFKDYLDAFVFINPDAAFRWSGKNIGEIAKFKDYMSDDCKKCFNKQEIVESLTYFMNKYPEYAKEIRNIVALNSSSKEVIEFLFNNIENFDLVVQYANSISGEDISDDLLNSINSYASEYVLKTLTSESDEKAGEKIDKYFSFLEDNNHMFITSNYIVRNACQIVKENSEAKIVDNNGLSIKVLNTFYDHMSSEITSALELKEFELTKRMSDLSSGYLDLEEYNVDETDAKLFCDYYSDYSLDEINKITFLNEFVNSFINRYKVGFENDEDRDKFFDACLNIFELYLSKCTDTKELGNSLPNKVFVLLNSKEFLSEKHKKRLEKLYNDVFLDKHRADIKQKMDSLLNDNLDSHGRNFIQRIESGENLDSSEFEKFKDYVIMSKAVNLSIDEKLLDYCFKHLVNNYNNETTNELGSFERVILCEKGQHLLDKFNLNEYVVVDKDIKDNSEGKHKFKAKEILINSSYRYLNPENELETLFHEVQHAKQFREMSTSQVQLYDMFKDLLIHNMDKDYYDNNYSVNKYEIDASVAQKIKTIEYYRKLGINKDIIDRKEDEYEREIQSRLGGLLRFDFEKIYNMSKEEVNKANITAIANNGKSINTRDFIFKELVKTLVQKDLEERPSDMPKIFVDCSTALMEFNQDGSRKNRVDILKEYIEYCKVNNIPEDEILVDENKIPKYYKSIDEEFIQDGKSLDEIGSFDYDMNRNIEALYVHILNTDPFLDNDEVIEEMNQINEMKIDSKKMNSLLDSIIEKDMLSRIDLWTAAKRTKPELFNGYIDERECYTLVQLLNTYSAKIERSNPLMSQRIDASLTNIVKAFTEPNKGEDEYYI